MVLAEHPGSRGTKYFQTSLEHILTELELMALKLHSKARKIRNNSRAGEADRFRGLYISDKEIDQFLEKPVCLSIQESTKQIDDLSGPEEGYLKELQQNISERKKEALERGLELRLDIIGNLFSLSRFEIDTLLICLLAETDTKYQKLYAYLQDDITKKAPTVNLVLNFLCDSPEKTLQARQSFYPEAPLIKHHLIGFADDRVSGSALLLVRAIHLDERIAGYLLGQDGIDSRITTLASPVIPQKKIADLAASEDLKSRLHNLISKNKNVPLICCLLSAYGSNNADIAGAICSELEMPMFIVNLKAFLAVNAPTDNLVSFIFREGLLQNSVIYLEDFDPSLNESKENASLFREIILEMRSYPNWVVLGLQKEWQPEYGTIGKPCINVKLSSITFSERLRVWESLVRDERNFAPDINVIDLAGKFKLSSGQILQATNTAKNLAKWRDPETARVINEDIYNACRKQSGENLNTLARKIKPFYNWEDIILPKDQMEQLREICRYVEHYHTVYDAWGFGRKTSLGKGLKVLFAGPSGTGKTMAAEVIGNELKIDLYKIDLSTIVSKYIGETEKNLDKIFREGQDSNAILFFDEADALFGKRSEVRDSHDRYANIETAYLLQKMDEYEGIVILATNLRKNMDDAFARRMHYTLEFPIPEEPDRYRIWRQVFPKESPLDEKIDFQFLARQFKISGGNIKNIALNAAFLAAANGGLVNMENLIKATKREYQKIGKLCTEVDFGEYFEIVKN
jgi:AAA+ superfamily predicted ATPase